MERARLSLHLGGPHKAALIVLFVLTLAFLAVWRVFFIDLPTLPDKNALWSVGRVPGIAFYDKDNRLIAVRGASHDRAAALETMPAHLINAFVAAEDRRFFRHDGVDERAILRAFAANLDAGRTVQGGSTITQQLIKNLVLTPEQSLKRKLFELRLAQELEQKLSKKEILELYLNRIYLGDHAYGVAAAARTYFDKSLSELTLGESALLAALPKAPSLFAAESDLGAARTRQGLVLDKMVEAGFITRAEAGLAREAAIRLVRRRALAEGGAAYTLDLAQAQIRRWLPDAPPDLIVRLTLDSALQAHAEKSVKAVIDRSGKSALVGQGAFLAMSRDGAVRALVGGTDYGETKFNRVTQALRQPGSTFKPFVYAAALEAGLSPDTIRLDAPVQVGKWAPRNYHAGFSGPVSLTYALAQSLNTTVVRLTREVGLDAVIEIAGRLGIDSPIERNYSVVLGASEVTLRELTAAYAPFAFEGFRVEPFVIAEIRNSRGQVLFRQNTRADAQAIGADVARQMTFMLRNAVQTGTGIAAQLPDREVAGKTGTSQDWRDAWFVGYTSEMIAGAWVGNDNRRPMRKVTGGTLPAEIWRLVMEKAHEGIEPAPLRADSGMRLTAWSSPRVALYSEIAAAFKPRPPPVAAAPVEDQLAGIY